MGNVELHRPKKISAFRKISLGTWRTAYDPSVYGTLEVDVERALDYIQRFREQTGKRLTMTHLMAKAAAAALQRMPDANVVLRFNKPYPRKRIGVFFQVAMTEDGDPDGDEKADLSGATLFDVDQKSLLEIIEEFETKVEAVRTRKDKELEKTRSGMRWVPALFLGWLLRFLSFCAYTLNFNMRWAGVPKDAFGSIMITNIGSLGLDQAYVPLVPWSRVPILIALGAAKPAPVVVDGAVAVRPMMKINATFDHRIIDGYHASVMSKVIHQWFEDPEASFGPVPEASATTSSDAGASAA